MKNRNFIKQAFLALTLASGIAHSAISGLGEGVYASFDTTKGNFVIELFYQQTPNTVGNFVGLVEGTKKNNFKNGMGFYDGLKFHRVIKNFMVQGGDPMGTGRGGPGYKFDDEITDLKHDSAGILSMANSGRNSNGSQFFITHRATPWLDGKHTVFGKVILGMDVVNSIKKGDVMDSVRVIRNGSKAIAFDANQIQKIIPAPTLSSCNIPGWVKALGRESQWRKLNNCL